MRLLHGLPRRHAGLRVPGRRRPGRRAATSSPSRGSPTAAGTCIRCSRRSSRPEPCSAGSARRDCSSPRTTCSPGTRTRPTPTCARRWPGTCAGAPATRRSSTRCGWLASRLREPGAGGCRGGRVTRLVLSGCHVVTMDAGRAEHASGYVVVDGNLIAAVGAGQVPEAFAGARGGRRFRVRGHARADQHPPSPVPVGDARAGRRLDAVRLADRAVSGLGEDRRADRARRGDRGAGLAGQDRLHDEYRPPLRVPARRRRRARRDHRGGPGCRPAVSSDAGVDGPGRLVGRLAARRGRRGHRRDPGRDRRGDRGLP